MGRRRKYSRPPGTGPLGREEPENPPPVPPAREGHGYSPSTTAQAQLETKLPGPTNPAPTNPPPKPQVSTIESVTQDILEYNSIVAPPKVKHYAVLVVWCFDVAHPHHEMVVAPGPAVGDAVSVAVAKVERERKGCAVTNVKAWPMAAGWSDR